MSRTRSRLWSIASCATVLMLLVSGCASNPAPAPGGTQGSSSTPPAKSGPVEGGTLTVANVADVTNMDPANMVDDPTWSVGSQIYEWLVDLSPDGKVIPALATEWTPSEDGKSWTIKLRQNVKFHDGTPFNAAAVKAQFERVLKPETKSPFAGDFSVIDKIDAPDDYTVIFRLKNPFAPFLSAVLMNNAGAIPSPAAIAKWGQDYSQHPVGTGAFKFDSWTPGQKLTVTKNSDYWGQKAHLDQIVFRPIPEPSTRIAELQSGSVDLLLSLQPNDLNRLESDPAISVLKIPYFNVHHIVFNAAKAPLDDLQVRKALSMAVDIDSIVSKMLTGVATPAYGIIPESSWGFDQSLKKPHKYDAKEAQAILEGAGWKPGPDGIRVKNGQKLSLTLYSPDHRYPNDREIMEFVQAQFKEIGVDPKLQVMEWGAYLDATYKRFEHQVMFIGWNLTNPDPLQFVDPFFKSDGWFRVPQWSSPEVDQLLTKAGQSTSQSERQQIYNQVQQTVANNYLVIPVFSKYALLGMKKPVQGLPAAYKPDLKAVWLAGK